MHKSVLITGGAGFLGSHLADLLLAEHCRVRVLDCLLPQVHGNREEPPEYLSREVEFLRGDVRDGDMVRKALAGVEVVFHFAASVGVGQSMYEIENYTSTNVLGTAVLLQRIIDHPVEKFIVASSMSVYGEGLYVRRDGSPVTDAERTLDQLKRGAWDILDETGDQLEAVPTPEWKTPALTSIYALSKFDQERMTILTGRAYGIPTVALRFFNAYGTRQALSNPYTGVLAIFASRYLNGNTPLIFEDGRQLRDFVSVHDIARACRLAMVKERVTGVFNIGSGAPVTIEEVATRMGTILGASKIEPEITGTYRVGDIRQCYADLSRSRETLGYAPSVGFEDGLVELAAWLGSQNATDAVEQATNQLRERGLTI